MSKKETINWPSDPYECPYCFYKSEFDGDVDCPF